MSLRVGLDLVDDHSYFLHRLPTGGTCLFLNLSHRR